MLNSFLSRKPRAERTPAGRLPSLIIALAAAVLVTTGGGCDKQNVPEAVGETPRNVRVMVVKPGTIEEYFEISGPVEPVRGTDLSAQETGPIVAITAAKGKEVDAGEIILEQDRALLRAEMTAARAALKTQSYNVDKVQQLHDAGKVSQIEMLRARDAFEQAEARASVTTERYERAAIRAPFAGVVTDRYVELGELAVPGMRMVRLIDPYTLKLTAYLTEEQVGWVSVGSPASVVLGSDTSAAPGRVSWVGFEADRRTGKFKVEMTLDNRDLSLRSGVIGRARLAKNIQDNVVTIPRGALLVSGRETTVYVVEAGRAVRRVVGLGASQGLMVQVTTGVRPGDQLVVRGQRDLREGSLVRVTETATGPDGATIADPATVTAAESGARVEASPAKADREDSQ